METVLSSLTQTALKDISSADTAAKLESIRIHYLGKKGVLTAQFSQLKTRPKDQIPLVGKQLNQAKQSIESALSERQSKLKSSQNEALVKKIDVSLPGRRHPKGALHPVTRVKNTLVDIFSSMGFWSVEGPEIEKEYYNFTALNMPEHHPARAMHDTFYFPGGLLLRTHTSPVQIRQMQNTSPPIYMVTPGRVYRKDSDPTHTPMFHQLEGLVIDTHTSFAHLRGLLENSLQMFFERSIVCRFRPTYFPFTEPSAELDIQCVKCEGKGCRICKQTGWLEVLGCGMVHPNVLAEGRINSNDYRGFAFGIGIDRLAMLRYGIEDLRVLFENDVRMLSCFA